MSIKNTSEVNYQNSNAHLQTFIAEMQAKNAAAKQVTQDFLKQLNTAGQQQVFSGPKASS